MIKPGIAEALSSLVPGVIFAFEPGKCDYESIRWLSEDLEMPSEEEVEAEIERLQEEWKKTEYQGLRRLEYPSLNDLADALYWDSKGDSSHLENYFAACEEVKNKHPKG